MAGRRTAEPSAGYQWNSLCKMTCLFPSSIPITRTCPGPLAPARLVRSRPAVLCALGGNSSHHRALKLTLHLRRRARYAFTENIALMSSPKSSGSLGSDVDDPAEYDIQASPGSGPGTAAAGAPTASTGSSTQEQRKRRKIDRAKTACWPVSGSGQTCLRARVEPRSVGHARSSAAGRHPMHAQTVSKTARAVCGRPKTAARRRPARTSHERGGYRLWPSGALGDRCPGLPLKSMLHSIPQSPS